MDVKLSVIVDSSCSSKRLKAIVIPYYQDILQLHCRRQMFNTIQCVWSLRDLDKLQLKKGKKPAIQPQINHRTENVWIVWQKCIKHSPKSRTILLEVGSLIRTCFLSLTLLTKSSRLHTCVFNYARQQATKFTSAGVLYLINAPHKHIYFL